jgi:uncharacterized delta-60 repeat protein
MALVFLRLFCSSPFFNQVAVPGKGSSIMSIRLPRGFFSISSRPATRLLARPGVEVLEDRTVPATIGFDNNFPVPFFFQDVPTTAAVIQADGKIVQVGSFLPSADFGNSQFVVTRYNPNGTLDLSFGGQNTGSFVIPFFNNTGGFNHTDVALTVAIQPSDRKIVVAGQATVANGDQDFAVARLNTDGTLDTAGFGTNGQVTIPFNLGGGNTDVAQAVVIQSDGKIVVAGFAETASNGEDFAITRLNTNGTLDTSGPGFGSGGKTTIGFDLGGNKNDRAQAVGLQSTGKIVLAGFAQTASNGADFAVARLNTDGTLDSIGPTAFGGNGKTTVGFDLGGTNDDRAFALAMQNDDGIILAGQAASTAGSDAALARLTADGFNNGIKSAFATAASAFAVALEPTTNKILLAGDVVAGPPVVMRANTDLTPDTTFNGTGTFMVDFSFNGYVASHAGAIALQSDGTLVVAGGAQRISPAQTGGFVVRLLEVPPTIPPTIPPVVIALDVFLTGFSVKLNPLRPTASKVQLTFHGTLRFKPGAFELRWGSLNIKLNMAVSPTADGISVELSLKLPKGKVPRGRTVTLITHGNLITLADGSLFDAARNGVPGSTRADKFTVPLRRVKGG